MQRGDATCIFIWICVYIHIWVITCQTPQPSNIQPCSSREGRVLIHRLPLALGTDLIFFLEIIFPHWKGEVGRTWKHPRWVFLFISRDKRTELLWKQAKKLINNLDQKLADQVPFFPLLLFWGQSLVDNWGKQASNVLQWYWCEDRMKFYIFSSSALFQIFCMHCPSIFTFFESMATASTCYQLFIKILSFFCSDFWL